MYNYDVTLLFFDQINMKKHHRPYYIFINLFLCLTASIIAIGCSKQKLSEFEVQKPSRITVPLDVKKVFIRKDLVNGTNDKLGIKNQVLKEMTDELNRFKRFEVKIVDTLDGNHFDPEKETIAIIQGEVTSGGEVDRGQFTDLATCTGGISGRISSAGAAVISNEVITLDNWRGYICRRGAFVSNAAEVAITSAFSLAGLKGALPPKNQVIRSYEYKNISLYAQANFSFNIIGLSRDTLAIRADSASFGRVINEKDSFRNVKESHFISLTLGSLISIGRIPFFPIPSREIALASRSNPKEVFYDSKGLSIPDVSDLPPKERKQIIKFLVKRILESFIQTISPYKQIVKAEVALGGKANAGELLQEGNSQKAKEIIQAVPFEKRAHEDWYNLGLAYEAGASSSEDYEDARRFYIKALELGPEKKMYAKAIGRTRRYLAETKKLARQIQN